MRNPAQHRCVSPAILGLSSIDVHLEITTLNHLAAILQRLGLVISHAPIRSDKKDLDHIVEILMARILQAHLVVNRVLSHTRVDDRVAAALRVSD